MRVPAKQKGLALLMLVFFLAVAITIYSMKALNASRVRSGKGAQTASALAEAKAALIGWSVSHPLHPGIMPFPDRNADGDYDGNSDCSSATPNFNLLIGRLPFLGQTAPCAAASPGLASSLTDGEGEPLWYAVSRNLIRTADVDTVPYQPVINPSIADAPIEDWLIVRDKDGNVISDRVAAVVLAPGAPVGGQDRSGGLAGPNAYLDRITVAGVSRGNNDYTVPNEGFIISDKMQIVSASDPRYLHPYEFNDQLVYITIDELMDSLEKRAVAEAASSLRGYYLASAANDADRYYPYAATLGDATHICVDGLLQGALPLAGCASPAFAGFLPPAWFTQNRWQDFTYYAASSDCHLNAPGCASGDIIVGTQSAVDAVVIATGAVIAPQARPSANANDYLDSVVNSNGDNVYDAVGTARTNIYNDQILIVAP